MIFFPQKAERFLMNFTRKILCHGVSCCISPNLRMFAGGKLSRNVDARSWFILRYYPRIFVDKLRKSWKALIEDNRELNLGLRKSERMR
jgi:hypothetical protein